MRKPLTLLVLVPLVLLLVSPSGVRAQEEVPEDRLKKEFFESLKRPQIVSLLETLDRTRQLTDFELGAKYRWGYIPPDRRPPVRLARWWQSKSQRERSNLRVEWFRNHYDQLNLNRSARELGLIDRLNRLHRELRAQLDNAPGNLEPVQFPGDTPDPSMSDSGETEYQPIYRQKGNESGSAPADQSSRDGSNSTTEQPNDSPAGDGSTDQTVSPEPDESSEMDTDAEDPEGQQDRNVRYRRVGDRIEVIEETFEKTDRPDTVPSSSREDSTTDGDRSTDDTVPSSPNLQLKNAPGSSSSMRLPEPSLRFPSNRTPELRRSNSGGR